MEIDLETFLTSIYCITADLYQEQCAAYKPKRRGKRVELSDDEVVTLMIMAQWYPERSERKFIEYAAKHWRPYFPRLLSQSQFNRRARDLMGVLAQLGTSIAQALTRQLGLCAYEVLDGLPGVLMRRCRGTRHRCFSNEASIGRGGSDRDWYYGVRLLTAVNQHGLITGFVIGPASTGERWLADALLCWRAFPRATPPGMAELDQFLSKRMPGRGPRTGPTGPIAPSLGAGHATAPLYLADLGFAGEHWIAHWLLDYRAPVLTQTVFDGQRQEAALDHQLHSLRQVVENINELLLVSLGFAFPKARTYWGLLTRYAAKVAACNLARYLNFLYDRPPFAHHSPFI